MTKTSLSVLVPVYNEEHLVAASLARLRVLATSPFLERLEIIVVDDCSRDSTPAVLTRFEQEERTRKPEPGATCKIEWMFSRHAKNGGKGKAIKSALARATCEVTVIHDADLEYHPEDLLRIVEVFVKEPADAVYGSRFAGSQVRRVLMYRHELGNRLLTTLTNLVTNLNVTDMETCYKAVRTSLLKSIPIESNDFRLEPELTIKLAKRKARIFEVPISYSGRTYQEGKKINWRDGVKALQAIAKFAWSDDVYVDDAHGSKMLARLSRAPAFNQWIAEVIRPYVGERVLELGAGIGNVSAELVPRKEYVATDVNPLCVEDLAVLNASKPYWRAQYTDVNDAKSFPRSETGGFDTVVCLNVVAYVEDELGALKNMKQALSPGGRAIVLVPQGQNLYGTLDKAFGHVRRYSAESLAKLGREAGFELEEMIPFNRMGTAAWYVNGKMLRRKEMGLGQVLAFNALTPAARKLDDTLPLEALSLIAVFKRPLTDVVETSSSKQAFN